MTDGYIIRESILKVLKELGHSVYPVEVFEKLPGIDEWDIKAEIWELARANKVNITREWKLELK